MNEELLLRVREHHQQVLAAVGLELGSVPLEFQDVARALCKHAYGRLLVEVRDGISGPLYALTNAGLRHYFGWQTPE